MTSIPAPTGAHFFYGGIFAVLMATFYHTAVSAPINLLIFFMGAASGIIVTTIAVTILMVNGYISFSKTIGNMILAYFSNPTQPVVPVKNINVDMVPKKKRNRQTAHDDHQDCGNHQDPKGERFGNEMPKRGMSFANLDNLYNLIATPANAMPVRRDPFHRNSQPGPTVSPSTAPVVADTPISPPVNANPTPASASGPNIAPVPETGAGNPNVAPAPNANPIAPVAESNKPAVNINIVA